MPRLVTKPAAWIAAAALSLGFGTASAQQYEESATALAQIHAIMEYCGVLTPQMLDIMKQRKQKAARETGVSTLVYDAAYLRAYTKSRKMLDEYGEEEKELTCQPMRAMAGQD
ncbi:hypothetical protein [Achromobacter anxifer]|uniref:hypothetical protein n=1 Tax=Achromobacter anxifer TaxID=1287737 RepID=UPI0021573444|nr:hypothetical protein [Achromobacter anxifer]MDF8363072.1 hypothetical protein [Achromobacter anxifer]